MGFGRRSFITRAATVVGTIGAAGSAESWARDAKVQKVPQAKPYQGYGEDILNLTLEVEKKYLEWRDWPYPDPPDTDYGFNYSKQQEDPEWIKYSERCVAENEKRWNKTGIHHTTPVYGPTHFSLVTTAMGNLEQEEAKPVLIVSAPADFTDFRQMQIDNPEINLVYDEGPIRCRFFTVPVVTSTKLGRGNILVMGTKEKGELLLNLLQISR
jgi:hypothetical protein